VPEYWRHRKHIGEEVDESPHPVENEEEDKPQDPLVTHFCPAQTINKHPDPEDTDHSSKERSQAKQKLIKDSHKLFSFIECIESFYPLKDVKATIISNISCIVMAQELPGYNNGVLQFYTDISVGAQ